MQAKILGFGAVCRLADLWFLGFWERFEKRSETA